MTERATRVHVESAGPMVTVQDTGRRGHRRFGVPASGPMDRFAHAAANVAVGNPIDAATIEVSMAGLDLLIDGAAVTIGVTGGAPTVEVNGEVVDPWSVQTLTAGRRLMIRPGRAGSWSYVAFAGSLRATRWLGSAATHAVSGFGGGALGAGQVLHVDGPRVEADREGSFGDDRAVELDAAIRVVLGPQEHHFTDEAVALLSASAFRLTADFDRMGVRLDGPALELRDALSIPSDPIVRGSVQVDGTGRATVLLADHQTTGGYPKIATIVSSDVDRLAQRRPGDPVRFEIVDADHAIQIARADAEAADAVLERIGRPGRNLAARLHSADLIGDHGTDADVDD